MVALVTALVVLCTPPVPGPVLRGFEPPPSPYAPGHVGLDYGVAPGEAVGAVTAGTVVFAGSVGATRHVTVRLADGRLVTVSFLLTVAVAPGDQVQRGQMLGTAGGRDPLDPVYDGRRLLLTLRVGGRYVDPATLFRPVDLGAVVHLVPWGARPSPSPPSAPVAPRRPAAVPPALALLAATADLGI